MTTPPVKTPSKRGGARPGAGRKLKTVAIEPDCTALEFLAAVMRDGNIGVGLRLKAAAKIVDMTVPRPAADPKKGKKEEKQERAETLAKSGKFAQTRPPLTVIK